VRRTAAAALGVLFAAAGGVTESQAAVTLAGPVPTAYELDLSYSARGLGRLSGTQRISFVNRGPATDVVWLRLWGNGPDRCRPRRVSVRVLAPARAGAERARCSALPVKLPGSVPAGGTGSVGLRFTVRGRRDRDRFGRSGNGAVLLGNVIPVLAVTDGLGLHLEPYVGIAESFYSLSAPWRATLRLPRRLRAATTGSVSSERLVGRRRVLQVGTPAARDFALAVGRFRVHRQRVGSVTVRVHSPLRRSGGRRMLRQAARALRIFSRRFGPYGSPEHDVVEISESYGMEYPELIFSPDDRFVLTHEVAHQWWYSIVGNNQYREPWLDESFAQYSTSLLVGGFGECFRRPFTGLTGRLRRARLDRSMRSFRSAIGYELVVYYAGSCALRSLERSLGRSRMRTLLRTLVARHRHGVMTKQDVYAAIAQVAPAGFDMRGFLRRAHLRR
jgi:Peptidase family M1 domain